MLCVARINDTVFIFFITNKESCFDHLVNGGLLNFSYPNLAVKYILCENIFLMFIPGYSKKNIFLGKYHLGKITKAEMVCLEL